MDFWFGIIATISFVLGCGYSIVCGFSEFVLHKDICSDKGLVFSLLAAFVVPFVFLGLGLAVKDYTTKHPTSKAVAAKIEQYKESLSKTDNLLNKRETQRDEAQQKFFDECASFNKSVMEVAKELQKPNSEQKIEPWFGQVRFYWLDWKSIERDVIVFSRQKIRLETSLRDLRLLFNILKRKEENDPTYIPGEDPELDKLVASMEVDLELDALYKDLPSGEKTEIDVAVSNKMQEAIKNSNTD